MRYRFILLPVTIAAVILGWPLARQLSFDQSIESLYPPNDPRLLDYQQSKRLFGGDEFAVVAYTDPHLIDEETHQISEAADQRVHQLADRLNAVEGINPQSTQNLAVLTENSKALAREKAEAKIQQMLQTPLVKRLVNSPDKRRRMIETTQNQAVQRAYGLVAGILIGEDRQTTAVVLRLTPEEQLSPGQTRAETIAEIRKVAENFGRRHDVHTAVVGEPVQVHDMFRYVEEDGRTLFLWSLGALSIVIFLLFRSLRWVLLPVLVVVVSIVWTDALLVLSGMKLSMVSSMMNSLVTIIGIATVTHITVHYRELREQYNRAEAMRRTLGDLLPPILWTCATTAVGFAALLSSDITPVRSFGLMMALATFMVFVSVAIGLPGAAALGRFDADPKPTPAEGQLAAWLSRSATFVQKHSVSVAVVMFALFGFSALGLLRLTVETDFSKNFRDESPIVRSLEFVESKLGGAGTWEVNFPAPETLDQNYLDKVRKLAQRLRKRFVHSQDGREAGITKVVAVTDGLDLLGSKAARLLFPNLQARLEGVNRLQPEFIPSLYNPEAGRMRIVLRAREQQQSAEKLKLIRQVDNVADQWAAVELSDQFNNPEAETTGLYVLLAFLIDNLLKDQLVSFMLAAVGIVVMMTIAFRSLKVGLLMLLPNTFPIALVIGGIGWLGIPINIATAMIASVSMGLTVDFSIHYLAGYDRSRRRGLSPTAALENTLRSVGRALVFANLALVVGFSVLTVSHFIPLVYFGVLVSFAMVGGLLGDLVLLPLIVRWIDRPVAEAVAEDAAQLEPAASASEQRE